MLIFPVQPSLVAGPLAALGRPWPEPVVAAQGTGQEATRTDGPPSQGAPAWAGAVRTHQTTRRHVCGTWGEDAQPPHRWRPPRGKRTQALALSTLGVPERVPVGKEMTVVTPRL